MKKIVFVLIFVISTVFSASLPKGDIKGKIVDAETKQPLIGANIIISGTAKGTSTDAEGNYSFNLVDVGTYVIEYSYIGYDKITKTDVIVRPDRTTYLNVSMRSSTLELENVVVSGGYFSESDAKPISSVNFSAEEIRRAPGSAGDVSRIVYGLPALAKVNDQRNSLIVRGGSPVENSFYLDNIEIPNISHFPVEGSSDGPIGILNTDFIENVNFNTGGFSPVYGDRLSSIMEISYREGNSDKFEPQLNLNLAGFGGLVEGPIGSNGNYMFAVNRSYLDLIISKDETGGAIPHYGDAQGKVVYNIDEKNKISLLGVFSIDEINLDYEDAVKTDLTNYYGSTDGIFNVAGLNWQHIYGKSGYSNTSIAHTFSKYDRSYSETKSQRHLFRNRSIENTIALRNVNYLKLNESNSIEFGVEGKLYLNNFDILFNEWQDHYGNIKPALIIDNNFNSFKTGIFALHSWQLMKKLRFEYGGRLDFFEYNGNVNVSPRASLIYDFSDITSLTASAGIFRQEIPNYLMIQNSNFKNLKTPYSAHYILGLSHLLTESTRLTIETYYKDYKYFPVDPDQPNIFLFDESMVDGLFLQHEKLVDDGKGYSTGIEVMIQKKLADEFYGMISGSISRTRYKDLNGTWHDRVYDNKFNFTVEGGYLPNDEWEFKVRWIYAGGVPYTPFDITESKLNNRGVWNTNSINSERLPDYHSLNIRVDKRFYFDTTNLIVYLSIWNAYGRENISQYVWNEIKNEPEKMKQWSTLPVLGIEYEF